MTEIEPRSTIEKKVRPFFYELQLTYRWKITERY